MAIPEKLHKQLLSWNRPQLIELQHLLQRLLRQQKQAQKLDRSPRSTARSSRHYTFRLEYVKCGKPGCSCARGKGHGPYKYKYWKEHGRLMKEYVKTKKRSRR